MEEVYHHVQNNMSTRKGGESSVANSNGSNNSHNKAAVRNSSRDESSDDMVSDTRSTASVVITRHSRNEGIHKSKASVSGRSRSAMVGMDGSVIKLRDNDGKRLHNSSTQNSTVSPTMNKHSSADTAHDAEPFKATWRGTILIGIVFLATFGGVFVSVLGTLGCEFLGYSAGPVESDADTASFSPDHNIFAAKLFTDEQNHTFTLQTSDTPTKTISPNIDGSLAWIGIFAYESTAFGAAVREATATESTTPNRSPFTAAATFCVEYDSEYFFGNAPFTSLYVAQIFAVLAPLLCLISFLLFFLEFAEICDNFHRHIRLLSMSAFLMFLLAAISQAITLIVFLEPELCERSMGERTEYACEFGTNAWLVVASSLAFLVCALALLTYYWLEKRYYYHKLTKQDFLPEDTSTDSNSSGNDENFNLYDGYSMYPPKTEKSGRKSKNPAVSTMRQNVRQRNLECQYLEDMENSLRDDSDKGGTLWGNRLDHFMTCEDDFDFLCGTDADETSILSK